MPHTIDYSVTNIRFEPESGGYVTIWFDLCGPAIAEPEAMTNMFVEFGDFLKYLAQRQPEMHEVLSDGEAEHGIRVERLEAAGFDWEEHLRGYLDNCFDLRKVEKERVAWLKARRTRVSDHQLQSEWTELASLAESNPNPTWDDVVHAIINSLNATAVELYPELLDFDTDGNNQLRDIIESHGERLANQLVALTGSVRKERSANGT